MIKKRVHVAVMMFQGAIENLEVHTCKSCADLTVQNYIRDNPEKSEASEVLEASFFEASFFDEDTDKGWSQSCQE